MIVYNHMLNKYTTISEGEELCPKCEGRGQIPLIDIEKNTVRYYLRCHKCRGHGKLDWVEKITGKNVKANV